MKMFLLLLVVLTLNVAARNDTEHTASEETIPPATSNGKSFFPFGAILRKFRQRLLGYHDPTPLFAGPMFPLYGYCNCSIYGCNPTMNYHTAPYENLNFYHYAVNAPIPLPPATYGLPQQPQQLAQQTTQQATQQQSNVVIYQRGQEQPEYYPPQQVLPAMPPHPSPAPVHPILYGANGFAGGANLPPLPVVNNYGNYVPTGPTFGIPTGLPYGALPVVPGPCRQKGYICNFSGL